MHKILELREAYRLLYSKYSIYIEAVIKFVVALIALIVINSHVGAFAILKNPLVVILISLVCAVLPKTLSAMLVMLTIVGHMFAISIEVALIVLVMFIVMYLLFFRFTSKESAVLVIMPILCAIGVPYIMPIILGLVASPVSAVSLIFGISIPFLRRSNLPFPVISSIVVIVNSSSTFNIFFVLSVSSSDIKFVICWSV